MTSRTPYRPSAQRGVVLVSAMLLLIVMTILALYMFRSNGVQELIAAAGCAFGEMPQFTTGGPKMTARKFLFECLQIPMDLSGVASLAAQVAAAI